MFEKFCVSFKKPITLFVVFALVLGMIPAKHAFADMDFSNLRSVPYGGSDTSIGGSGPSIGGSGLPIGVSPVLPTVSYMDYSINITDQSLNIGINNVSITLITLDKDNNEIKSEEIKTTYATATTSMSQFNQIPKQKHIVKVVAPGKQYILSGSSATWGNMGLVLESSVKDDASGVYTYTFSTDLSAYEKDARSITLNFYNSDAQLIIDKTFDPTVSQTEQDKDIWIGILSEADWKANNISNMRWEKLDNNKIAQFAVERYIYDTTKTSQPPNRFYIFEYAPNSMKPSTKNWVPYDKNYFPEGNAKPGYSLYYRHAPLTINSNYEKYTLENTENKIEFDFDASRDLKYDLNHKAYAGTKWDWLTNKTASPTSIDLTDKKGSKDIIVDYTVEFTKDKITTISGTTVYFNDIYLNLVYNKFAAIGQNFIEGTFYLYRNDKPNEPIDQYTIKSNLTQFNSIDNENGNYIKLLESDTLKDPNFNKDNTPIYTIEFEGKYVYNYTGDHSEITTEFPVITSGSIDSDNITVEPTTSDSPAKDATLKNFKDTITIPSLASAVIPQTIIIEVNGDYNSEFEVTAENAAGPIVITIPELNNLVGNKIIVTYQVKFQDESYEIPCSTGYKITNAAYAQGVNTGSNTPTATAEVAITTTPDAYFTVSKELILPETSAVLESGVTFGLYQEGKLVGSARTGTTKGAIIMKDGNPDGITSYSTIEEYNKIYLVTNPTGTEKFELRINKAEITYPPNYFDGTKYIKWEDKGTYWSREISFTKNTGLTGIYAQYNGLYCGPTEIKTYNIPGTKIEITKTGLGLESSESNFYAVNGTKVYTLIGTKSGTSKVYTLAGLAYGSYDIYELTNSTLKPSSGWVEQTNPVTGITVSAGKTLYKLSTSPVILNANALSINLSVENVIRTDTLLEVTKNVATGDNTKEFGFIIKNSDMEPLEFTGSGLAYKYKGTTTGTTIKIKDGERIVFTDLPMGTYTVVETDAQGLIASYSPTNGLITLDSNVKKTVTITNNSAPTMTINKTLSDVVVTNADVFKITISGKFTDTTPPNVATTKDFLFNVAGKPIGTAQTVTGVIKGEKYTVTETATSSTRTYTYTVFANTTDIKALGVTLEYGTNYAIVVNNTINSGNAKITVTKEVPTNVWGTGFKFDLYHLNGDIQTQVGATQTLTNAVKTYSWTTGLIVGEKYRLYERNVGAYLTSITVGGIPITPTKSGLDAYVDFVITTNTEITINAKNDLTTLEVIKKVTGNATSQTFKFKVKDSSSNYVGFKDVSGKWFYDASGTTKELDISTSTAVKLYGLPYGTYTVEETNSQGYNPIYSANAILSATDLLETITITNTAELQVEKKLVNGNNSDTFKFKLFELDNSSDSTPTLIKVKTVGGVYSVDSAGSDTFSITGANTITITGVTTGKTYYVIEEPASGYKATYGAGVETNGSKVSVIVPTTKTDVQKLTVTNTIDNESTKLRISKTKTAGSYVNDNEVFKITVKGNFAGTREEFTANFANNASTGINAIGTEVEVPDILIGETYTITESAGNANTDILNYNVTNSPASHTVTAGTNKLISINNQRKTGDITIEKSVIGTWGESDEFEFILTLDGSPVVGAKNVDSSITTGLGGEFKLSKTKPTVTFKGLAFGGKYVVTESPLAAGSSYKLVGYGINNATLIEANSASVTTGSTVVFTNERLSNGEIELTKSTTDNAFWPELGFEFKLYKGDTQIGKSEFATSLNPTIKWSNLENGNIYRVYEQGNSGFIPLGTDWKKAEITDTKGPYYYEANISTKVKFVGAMVNTPTELIVSKKVVNGNSSETFKFKVLDSDKKVMNFTNSNGKYIYDAAGIISEFDITQSTPISFYALPMGEYTVLETNAKGYSPTIIYDATETKISTGFKANTANTELQAPIKAKAEIINTNKAKIIVEKTLENSTETLKKFTFTLYSAENNQAIQLINTAVNEYRLASNGELGSVTTLDLIGGQKATILNPIPGKSYYVAETTNIGYTARYVSGIQSSNIASEVIITIENASDEKLINIINSLDTLTTMLNVTKSVQNYTQTDEFIITVARENGNSIGEFTFAKNASESPKKYAFDEIVKVPNIQIGEKYVITEKASNGAVLSNYITTANGLNNLNPQQTSGDLVIAGGQIYNVKFINTMSVTNSITITKNVIGVWDNADEFTFVLKKDNAALANKTSTDGLVTTDSNGEFKLSSTNSSITFADLELNANYTVEEKTSSMNDKYQFTSAVGENVSGAVVSITTNGDNKAATFTNTRKTSLEIIKNVQAGNSAIDVGTYYFNITDESGNLVPITQNSNGYMYDTASTNYEIAVTTAATNQVGLVGTGSVKISDLPYGINYIVNEDIAKSAGYNLVGIENNKFIFDSIKSSNTTTATNAKPPIIPGGGGGGSGGGSGGSGDNSGSTGADSYATSSTTIIDNAVPLAAPPALQTILDEDIPLSGGLPIEVFGITGISMLLLGAMLKRKKN